MANALLLRKIERCCALAARQKLSYVWIDTCCIDKSSSAELSEAINSMYQWYRNAECCYVYLSDMFKTPLAGDHNYIEEDGKKVEESNATRFKNCRWFRRGWCLQELLAPFFVTFYDRDWDAIGGKRSLWKLIIEATKIQPKHLWEPGKASIAQKMSWAAHRETTRVEDMAYCLLGLFNVNMPLLYGEGEKAFMRLQHEILRSSDDETIFVWTNKELCISGLLASSPADFADSGDIVVAETLNHHRSPYFMTNQGLQIDLMVPRFVEYTAKRFETPFSCRREGAPSESLIHLHMAQLEVKGGKARAMRTAPFSLGVENPWPRDRRFVGSTYYIKDVTCDKYPEHTMNDWFEWRTSGDEAATPRRLPLMLCEMSLQKEDESRTITEEDTGFFIMEKAGRTTVQADFAEGAISRVSWPRHETSPDTLKIYIPNGSPKLQWPVSGSAFDNSTAAVVRLPLGNSLITWLRDSKFLFIALREGENGTTYIDMEAKRFAVEGEAFKHIKACDPMRNHPQYPDTDSDNILDPGHALSAGQAGGLTMYGEDVGEARSWIGPTPAQSFHDPPRQAFFIDRTDDDS